MYISSLVLMADLMILTWNNLCFTEFSAKIHWNPRLAASDVFHVFTQSIFLKKDAFKLYYDLFQVNWLVQN